MVLDFCSKRWVIVTKNKTESMEDISETNWAPGKYRKVFSYFQYLSWPSSWGNHQTDTTGQHVETQTIKISLHRRIHKWLQKARTLRSSYISSSIQFTVRQHLYVIYKYTYMHHGTHDSKPDCHLRMTANQPVFAHRDSLGTSMDYFWRLFNFPLGEICMSTDPLPVPVQCLVSSCFHHLMSNSLVFSNTLPHRSYVQ